jgi:hypothetical protein
MTAKADYIAARASESLSYGDLLYAQEQGWCGSSPDGMGPHRPDDTTDPVTCAECGATIDDADPLFDYDAMPPQSTMVSAIAAATNDELVPIISETDGGIIGYAVDRAHAVAMVRALNAGAAEYEKAMTA